MDYSGVALLPHFFFHNFQEVTLLGRHDDLSKAKDSFFLLVWFLFHFPTHVGTSRKGWSFVVALRACLD